MKRPRIELALERIGPGEWQLFEKFASAFLAPEFPEIRTMAAPSGDEGRDAELFNARSTPSVVLQYSVTKEWPSKIRSTAKKIKKNFSNVFLLIYVTNQTIGANSDSLKIELQKQNLVLDIRDKNWFAERVVGDPQREAIAEALAQEIVDPYISSPEVVSTKAQALSEVEARAAFVYLGLQWEDDTREKGLTKLSFEALVRAALRNTDSNNRISRAQVKEIVRTFLPTHPAEKVDIYTDKALTRLTKRYIRHWLADDSFCLAHVEKLRLAEQLTKLEQSDIALEREIIARSKAYIEKTWGVTGVENEMAPYVRRVLEKFLLGRGEIFAAAVNRGRFDHFGFDGLSDIVIRELAEKPPSQTLDAKIITSIAPIVRDIILSPDDATAGYLRNLADSYTLMAFLRETPDVQSAVTKMFSHGEIWLDTSLLLPLFAEDLFEEGNKRFTGMIMSARESGLKFHATFGVIEELERHMNQCLTCLRTTTTWQGKIPYLYSQYIYTGRSKAEFSQWLERFRGSSRPEDDIAEYLNEKYGIERTSLESEANSAPDELRAAVKEAWTSVHERRRRQVQFDIDQLAMLRLADHDVENYLGILAKRRGDTSGSHLGHKHWFLTLDRTAYDIDKTISQLMGGKGPGSPVLSADFLVNYLTFGPVRSRIPKDRDQHTPIVMDTGVLEYLPVELLEIAEKVRNEAKNLPEYVIRRRVRDELDSAKRRLGILAQAGLPDPNNTSSRN